MVSSSAPKTQNNADQQAVVEMLTRAGVGTARKIAGLPHVKPELVAWAIHRHDQDGFTEPGRLVNWLSDPRIVKEYEAVRHQEERQAELMRKKAEQAAQHAEQERADRGAAKEQEKRQQEREAADVAERKFLADACDGLPDTERDAIVEEIERQVGTKRPVGMKTKCWLAVRARLLAMWEKLPQDERENVVATFPADRAGHRLAILKAMYERWMRSVDEQRRNDQKGPNDEK